jgi:hypothetical protein
VRKKLKKIWRRWPTTREALALIDDKMLFADGFEDAIMGYVERFGMGPVALYDREKCIRILVKRDKMTRDEANEFFEYNTIGAWMGDGTPCFATRVRDFAR